MHLTTRRALRGGNSKVLPPCWEQSLAQRGTLPHTHNAVLSRAARDRSAIKRTVGTQARKDEIHTLGEPPCHSRGSWVPSSAGWPSIPHPRTHTHALKAASLKVITGEHACAPFPAGSHTRQLRAAQSAWTATPCASLGFQLQVAGASAWPSLGNEVMKGLHAGPGHVHRLR